MEITKDMQRLKEIDCFLFDMDGTIYIEGKLIDGAKETLEFLKERGKKVIFLTNNSSVSACYYVKKLEKMGIMATTEDIYTSGNATTALLLREYQGKTVYLVGTNELKKEFLQCGITLVEDNPDIVVLSYDKELTYEKLVKATRFITFGATYIATHPDINCPATPVYEPDIGSFMALIEKSTGKSPDVICGKPYPSIAKGVESRVNMPSSKIAMVGDRLMTDIRFGNLNHFLSVLVLTGETTLDMAEKSDIKADLVLNSINDIKNVIL